MSRILDKSFKYTPAAQTDIRKTFAKYLREQARLKQAALDNQTETNVTSLEDRLRKALS